MYTSFFICVSGCSRYSAHYLLTVLGESSTDLKGKGCEFKMQGNLENMSRVPWSRHMSVFRRPTLKTKDDSQEDFIGGTHRRPIKKKQSTSENSSGTTDPRRVKSESSYLNGGKPEVDEESWDSQSDPGSSNCSRKWKECEGNNKSKQKAVQGRGASQPNGVRKRIKAQADRVEGSPGNGDFVMEIGSQERSGVVYPSNHIPRYVDTYYHFMYYACLNPSKCWSTKQEKGMKTPEYFLAVIQKIIFCYIAIMATFYSLNAIKYFVLNFLDARTLNNFIDIGYFVVSGVFQLYIVYFIAIGRQQHVSKSNQDGDDCGAAEEGEAAGGGGAVGSGGAAGGGGAARGEGTAGGGEAATTEMGMMGSTVDLKKKIKWMPILNGIVTVVMAAIKTVPWDRLHSFEKVVSKHSAETVDALFVWTPEDFDKRHSILNYYFGDRDSFAFYIMGLVGFISALCWSLLADCFKDVIFWVAKEHERRTCLFGKKIKENLIVKTRSGQSSNEMDDQCWKMYRDLVQVNRSTNTMYHTLLALNHLDTFLTFSYFLTLFLKEEYDMVELITTGYDVLKGILAYLPARRSSLENEVCRRWIQTLPCETKRFRAAGGTSLTREVMLWELKEEPLGLGSGRVHINNEFLVSFITLVASLFCFLLNLDKKDGDAKQY